MVSILFPGLLFIWSASLANLNAQSPSATAGAAATPAGTPAKTASPPPTPATSRSATGDDLVDSLTAEDLQTALAAVKKNFANPAAVDDTQVNRATLQGLLLRLSKGLLLLPGKETNSGENAAVLYAEILEGHIGYVRPGAVSAPNLQALDKKLADFAAKKVDALVMDLRASDSGDFATAAEFAKRFVPRDKTLFSLRKQNKQDRTFMSDRDPAYNGLIVVLADNDTTGPAEAFALALRSYDKALVIGEPTAGGAVDYTDLALPSGKVLRIAAADCIGADGRALYPTGINPDLAVDMAGVDKRQIFRLSKGKGMAPFTHEIERPHLNEAALIAGTNPELETSEQRRSRAQANAMVDPVLQRALDLITSLEIYRKR